MKTPSEDNLSCDNISSMINLAIDSTEIDQLTKTYLLNSGQFWSNVQEPSTRVSDHSLLTRLAAISLVRFDDLNMRAAAVVNLCYRSTEKELSSEIDTDALPPLAAQIRHQLNPDSGFSECRWFLSLLLGEAAFWMARGQFGNATAILKIADSVHMQALGHGQLYTNVVKSLLLRLVNGTHDGFKNDSLTELIEAADRSIDMAKHLTKNYVFSNQYSFEEVAYVYTMLRQIYNWRHCHHEVMWHGLGEMEKAGFAWRCVGGPFNRFLPKT